MSLRLRILCQTITDLTDHPGKIITVKIKPACLFRVTDKYRE